MIKVRRGEQQPTLRNSPSFFFLSFPSSHPSTSAGLRSVFLLIVINDTEQHDPTFLFHPRDCLVTDQCPLSSILILWFTPKARWKDYTLASTHSQMSVRPHSLHYLLRGAQHTWPGISGLVFCVYHHSLCACVMVKACNKVSMWPPSLRAGGAHKSATVLQHRSPLTLTHTHSHFLLQAQPPSTPSTN